MKVAHFNTFDSGGGAAKATLRLHRALLQANFDSTLCVAYKATDSPRVVRLRNIRTRLYRFIDAYVLRALKPSTVFFPDLLGTPPAAFGEHIKHTRIIHLHWVANFLASRQIRQLHERTRAPVVWTLLDMSPLTGGCHYAWECPRYMASCGRCPQLQSNFEHDLSRWTWRQKHKNFQRVPITMVAPTVWIAERAKRSSLFRDTRIVTIPVPIDDMLFHPADQAALRDKWQMSIDTKLIFLGAGSLINDRKGMRYMLEALNLLKTRLGSSSDLQISLLVAGSLKTIQQLDWPFPIRALGYLDDLALAAAYQCADIFVCPSIEDAGPMMIPEAMMCGTPVVAFDSGGAPDLIETMRNGYRAKYKDASDLADGIYRLLAEPNPAVLRANAHARATQRHAASVVAAQYMDLYDSLVSR